MEAQQEEQYDLANEERVMHFYMNFQDCLDELDFLTADLVIRDAKDSGLFTKEQIESWRKELTAKKDDV